MKYFCPLENVGKIEGRKRNNTIVKTTEINGWEISSDGIYAGSNNTLTDLPIVSKNWSIDKNGNVITNGNITANNGIFKNIYALKNNFFIENRSGTYNLNVIHLDNFELIKNNRKRKFSKNICKKSHRKSVGNAAKASYNAS